MASSVRQSRPGCEGMSGGKIFQKPNGLAHFYDQITIGGYLFEAALTIQEKRGDPSAIHCGRILALEMTYDDDLVAFFDDGRWYNYPDDLFGEGQLAVMLLINEWSKDKPVPFAGNKIPWHTELF